MAEKVGDGYVEVGIDVDRSQVRRKAEDVVKEIENVTKRRNGNIFKWMFTPNESALQALRTGIPSMLSTPLGIAAIATAAIFASAFVGALATTLLTAGLGGAFLAAGTVAMFAFNKRLGELGKKTVETLKGVLTRAAQPLAKPLEGALRLIESAAKRIEPVLKGIFAGLAPAIKPLTAGLIGLVENALPGFQRSLGGINAVFRALGEHLPKLGTAIGDFFAELTKDPALLERVTGILITWVRQVLKVAGPLLEGLTVIFGAWVNGWRALRMVLDKIDLSSITSKFDSGAWQQVKDAFSGVWSAVKNVWQALREFAAANTDEEVRTKFLALAEKLKVLWSALGTFLKEVWNWAWGEIKKIWNETVEPWLKQEMSALLDWLISEVGKKLGEMKDRAIQRVQDTVEGVVTSFLLLPLRVLAAIASIPGMVVGVFAQIPGKVQSALSGLPGRVLQIFGDLSIRVLGQISFMIGAVIGALLMLPVRAAGAIASLPGRVVAIFNYVRQNAGSIAQSIVNSVVGFFTTLPVRAAQALSGLARVVQRAVSGAGSWLVDAGRAIINGLIRGIQSQIPSLGGALGALGKFIKDHKGPIEKDRKMLIPQGRAVMQGFQLGIASELGSLKRQLSGITLAVPQMAMTAPAVRPRFESMGTSGTSATQGVSNTQNFYINTHEIDPRRHSQELGWELQGRLK